MWSSCGLMLASPGHIIYLLLDFMLLAIGMTVKIHGIKSTHVADLYK